jgi:hypothetical protein
MKTVGYSGTPLAKKLGYKENYLVRLIGAPAHYRDLLGDLPPGCKFLAQSKSKKNLIHYFTKSAAQLAKDMKNLRTEIEENGIIWISWPKKASKIETDVTEDLIRTIALKNDLVDVKVCAIDETWSGLKLMIRLKHRK